MKVALEAETRTLKVADVEYILLQDAIERMGKDRSTIYRWRRAGKLSELRYMDRIWLPLDRVRAIEDGASPDGE